MSRRRFPQLITELSKYVMFILVIQMVNVLQSLSKGLKDKRVFKIALKCCKIHILRANMKSKNLQIPQKEIECLESARTMGRGRLNKRRCWDLYISNKCNSTFSARRKCFDDRSEK